MRLYKIRKYLDQKTERERNPRRGETRIILVSVILGFCTMPSLAGTPPDPLPLAPPHYRILFRGNKLQVVPAPATAAPLLRSRASAASGPSGVSGSSAPPQPPQTTPQGIDQVAVASFDALNNALRINALLVPGGVHTPADANQVFTSIFDPVNNAVRVNCVLGCGSGGGGSFTAAGDLSGSGTSQTVIGLQTRLVASTAPTANQVLAWNGSAWTPTTPAASAGAGACAANQFVTGVNLGSTPTCAQPSFANLTGTVTPAQFPAATGTSQGAIMLAKDLAGSASAPLVAGLQGNPVGPATPTSGQALVWNGFAWTPTTLAGGATLQVNGVNTASQTAVNFQNGSNITVSNPSAGNVAFNLSGTIPIANGGTGLTAVGTSGLCLTSTGTAFAWGSCGTGATLQVNGTNTASQTTVNFQNGTNITVSNPSAGNVAFNLSGSIPVANGGTGQSTAAGAFNALAPATAVGGLVIGTGTNTYGNLSVGTSGQCLTSNGTTAVWGACASGSPGSALLAPTASQTIQPAVGSNITPLAVAPATGATQTADLLDVWKDSAMTTKAFWVDASGNLNFAGNNATYGATGQTTQSFLRLYGSTTGSNLAPPYLDLEKVDASVRSYLAPSTSVNGLVCVSATVPGGDCVAGTTLTTNPMTTAGDLILGGAPNSLGVAVPTRLAVGSSGQCLSSNGTTEVWAACGSGGGLSATPSATQTIQATGPSVTGLVVKQPTGGTSDIFDIEDSSSNKLFYVDSSGVVRTGSTTQSGTLELGSPSSTSASSVLIHGGNAASNGAPGYLKLAASPADAFAAYLVPSGTVNGRFFETGTTPSADSTDFLLSRNSTDVVTNKTFDSTDAFSGYFNIATVANPGNPATGNIRLYADSTSGNLTCLTSSGGNCLPSGGGSSAFNSITSGTNTAAAMVVGSGASIATSGTGTITATSLVDSNQKTSVATTATTSAVDYFNVTNGASGNPGNVTVGAAGSDTNIALQLVPKGNGNILLGASGQIFVNPGSSAVIASTGNNIGISGGFGTTDVTFYTNSLGTIMGRLDNTSGVYSFNLYNPGGSIVVNGQASGSVAAMNLRLDGNAQYYSVQFTAGAAIAAGQVVCGNGTTANSVVPCPVSSPGPVVGIAPVAISNAAVGDIAVSGVIADATADGSCTTWQYAVLSTATAGDIHCVATPTLGSTIGKVTNSSGVQVLVHPE